MLLGNSQINSALAELQRATTPDEVWRASERLLRAAMPIFHVLMGLPSLGIAPMFLRTSLPIRDTAGYFGRLAQIAPLNEILQRSPGLKVTRMSDHFVPQPGTAFYEEFMKPDGWQYSAAMLFWSESGEFIGQLTPLRTAAQGDITDAEMDLLHALHVQVHAALTRLLALENAAAARLSLEHSIHALPLPLLVLNWDLEVNYSNPAAREAISAWSLNTHPSVRAREPSDRLPRELHCACVELKKIWEHHVVADGASLGERSVSLAHPSVSGFRAIIQLVHAQPGRSLQPSFAIHFYLPPKQNAEAAGALAHLLTLSPAERRVARLAAGGDDNSDIAKALGVSLSTVRSHLRSIFHKLGITSRSRLAPLYQAIEREVPR
jgi:DNA-binding CsgD family transcriptional regulator